MDTVGTHMFGVDLRAFLDDMNQGHAVPATETVIGSGLLSVPDPRIAAHHFTGLLLWIPSSQMMFAPGLSVDEQELDAIIDSGTQIFLRAYS